jgi:hypothetical protein
MMRGNVSLGLTLSLAIAENIAALGVRYSVDGMMGRQVLPPTGTAAARVVVMCRIRLR